MQEFDFVGCERLRRNRKGRYITVDLAFPTKHWKDKSAAYVRQYLVVVTELGLRCCVERLQKDKVVFFQASILDDFQGARIEFLAGPG